MAKSASKKSGGPFIGRIRQIVVWIFAAVMLLLLISAYFISTAITSGVSELRAEYDSLQMTVTAPPEVPDAEGTLVAELVALRDLTGQLENALPTLLAAHVDWPAIMTLVGSFDRTLLRLEGFTYDSGRLVLEGKAVAEVYILEYVKALEVVTAFTDVQVQSITFDANTSAAAEQAVVDPAAVPIDMSFSYIIHANF